MLGDIPEIKKSLADTLKMALEAKNYYTAVTVFFYQSRVAYYEGRLQRSLEISQDGWARLKPLFKNPEQDCPAIRSLYVMQGVVLLEWNRLDEAEQILDLATDRVGWAPWVEIIAYEALVRLWEIRGDSSKVIEILNRMDKMGPQIASCAEALRYRHLTANHAGDIRLRDLASEWSKTHTPNLGTSVALKGVGPFQVDAEYIVFIAWLQVQTAIGKPQATLAYLTDMLAFAEERGLIHRSITLSIIKAQALRMLGENKRSLEVITHALMTAQPRGYINIFNRGQQLTTLLIDAVKNGIAVEYIESLRVSFAPYSMDEKKQLGSSFFGTIESGELVEPLSEREIEVLRLLSIGMTLAEVAKHLYLSPNTLKAHTQNIYSKLNVHSRVEAANKARELGLI